ncbi:MAG: TIGR03749 family integrating conjugative element protein [Candidatus Thiodiazotropha endolucinida]
MFKWRHFSLWFLMLSVLPSVSFSDHPVSPEHIVWDRSPIQVTLPLGNERRIDFPVPVKLNVPKTLINASKPIQIREDGSVYWTATKAFDAQRVQAITFTGYSYFLDVSAKKEGASHPIVILDDRLPVDEIKKTADKMKRLSYDYDSADLVRYASQHNYAPTRLIKALPGITRIPVSSRSCTKYLYRFHPLSFEPVAQWQSPTIPTRYITAVRVTSSSSDEVVFDPRLLRGDWIAASAQHAVLDPAGTDGDNTTWYLVSEHPFEETCQRQTPYSNVLSRSSR